MSLRIIIVGFGFMGQTHSGNLLKNPLAEVAGIVDPCSPAERLATIKGNNATVFINGKDVEQIPHYPTLEEALALANADAAIIALPTKLHCSAVVQCLEAGLHVMVEKPFSIDCKECDRMLETARKKTKLLAVGHVVRFMKEYVFLRDTILSGRLGKLQYMTLSRFTGLPTWGNWADPEFFKASGGALFDLVSHDIDFIRFCLGEPESIFVHPLLCNEFNGNQISAVMQYPDVNVGIDGGFITPPAFPFQRGFHAFFEKGTISSPVPGSCREITLDGTIREEDFSDDNPYYTETDNFLKAISSNDISKICTGNDAARTIYCCHTISEQIKKLKA
jgi:predicted dehydrogenase